MQSCENVGQEQYRTAYELTRASILTLSGLTSKRLDAAAMELEIHYGFFCSDYSGPSFGDPFMGFQEMLRQWDWPWPYMEESCLNDLSLPQIFFAWSWRENNAAREMLKRVEELALENNLDYALRSVIGAVKALDYAKYLLARGQAVGAQR